MSDLLDLLRGARVFDLAQTYFVGMPHYPTHPPFLFSLTRKHPIGSVGIGSASDAIAFSGHCGTHMDALCHFSRDGKVHGGTPLDDAQSWATGVGALSIDTVAPTLRRGVLLDIAGRQGVDALPDDFVIAPEHLEAAAAGAGVAVEPGDVVLLRTGRGRYWDDPVRYFSGGIAPGPEVPAARWLSGRKIFAAGSDTMSFEKVPSAMPVHAHLLVDSGIHLIECLNLEELAAARLYSFLFVALPLKIRGGTGSPIRPIAVAL